MALPYSCGPYIGLLLAGTMPAFMRCQVCPPHFTDEDCVQLQRNNGCHACDRRGCWHTSPGCPFVGRSRVNHRDADLGDTVPHMRETRITCIADGVDMVGQLRQHWWALHRDVRFTVNGVHHFSMGKASGDQCNCLIDTLRQQLHLECDIRAVRAYVQARHPNLVLGDFLELQHHWRDVVSGLAFVAGNDIVPALTK